MNIKKKPVKDKKEKKPTPKKDDNDNQVIENNIKISIDLKDLQKPNKKKRKPRKKKSEVSEALGGGAGGAMGGANFAPRPFSGVKIQSPDNNFNPNTTTNMIISSALQNALSGGNRPNFNFPALTAPTLPQQALLTAPPQQPQITYTQQQPQITAPPQQPQIIAPIPQQALSLPLSTQQQRALFNKIVYSTEAEPFHKAIANELLNDNALVNLYKTNKSKRGVKKITKAYQDAINNLQGNILNIELANTGVNLNSLLGQTVSSFYEPSLKMFKDIVDKRNP